jgi:hypothetical protein
LLGTQGADGVGEQCGDDAEEVLHVGESGVGVKSGFVEPFGVNGEGERFADGLEEMNAEAAGFGTSGGDDAEQFIAELLFFVGEGFEADEDVKRHGWHGIVTRNAGKWPGVSGDKEFE